MSSACAVHEGFDIVGIVPDQESSVCRQPVGTAAERRPQYAGRISSSQALSDMAYGLPKADGWMGLRGVGVHRKAVEGVEGGGRRLAKISHGSGREGYSAISSFHYHGR